MRNIKLIIVAISLTVMSFAISATGHPSTTANVDNKLGKKVFEDNCVVCHANGNNTVEVTKTLKMDALKANGFSSVDDVKKRVLEGKAIMPSFKETLKVSEIEAVANYVWNQAQTNSWK